MKFTLSWLKDHLDTAATVQQVVDAMTMAGLEVEHVEDRAAALAPFSVAKIASAVQHPNADRLRVCQVDTVDGRKEIVCGAPNARAGLTTIYAPIGAYVPGLGVTLVEKPVRGVVSNGMLCSGAELEVEAEADGILDLPGTLSVGTPAAEIFGVEAVIDFEVTPNRPDWLGVRGIARDLAAAGLGKLKPYALPYSNIKSERPREGGDPSGRAASANANPAETQHGSPPSRGHSGVGGDWPGEVAGTFPSPIQIKVDGQACRVFAGRLVRGVKNGPSPAWLQDKLKSVGLKPISALVDITNYVSLDRCRPLHVYDAALLSGSVVEARKGLHSSHGDEHLIALDGKTYDIGAEMSVIADANGERPIGLGGVMGGASTGCSDATTDVFIESAWFDPIVTAQTGRDTGITSDAQYRFARGVDPQSVRPGLDLATQLILDLCGGEASEVVVAGEAPAPPAPFAFDPAYVQRLSGLNIGAERVKIILQALGFQIDSAWNVTPPSWRRDVDGPADLVEEVARIEGFAALPSTPLPEVPHPVGGVLTPRQSRARAARRALAALGWQEAITFSFTARKTAALFGGGAEALVLANPIAAELDCMRPSILPNLIEAAARTANKGFADAALFEIGPVFAGDQPGDQRTAIAGLLAPHQGRHWAGFAEEDVFSLKADLLALLAEIGAPVDKLQLVQGQTGPWWHPGRSARLQLGPKAVIAEFGELHPGVLKALDADAPMLAFELWLEAVPEPKKKALKTRPAFRPSSLMPLKRDFAFVVDQGVAAGDLARAVATADKALIASVEVFDVYQGAGVPAGKKSLALEVTLQPREATLTDSEIEKVSAAIVAAAGKACGAALRG